MDRKTLFSAYGWAASNFLLIFVIFVLEFTILRFLLLLVVEEIYTINPKSTIEREMLITIVIGALIAVYAPSFFIEVVTRNMSKYKVGLSQPSWLGQMIKGMCHLRKHPMPDIIIEGGSPSGGQSIMAGIVDLVGKNNLLIMGNGLFNVMSKEQIMGILSHELRHSKAFENLFEVCLKALKITLIIVFNALIMVCSHKAFGGSALSYFILALSFMLGGSKFGQAHKRVVLTLIVAWGLSLLLWVNFSKGTLIISSLLTGVIVCYILEQLSSRAREFKTDVLAAIDMGTARPLINSLDHIHHTMKRNALPDQMLKIKFMESIFGRLISSHPPIEKRIAILGEIFSGHQKLKPQLQHVLLRP